MARFERDPRLVGDVGEPAARPDHGAAGATFVLGDKVKGGHYGEMPSLDPRKLVQGDLNPNQDFRGIYSTILDKWMHLNPVPIVNGTYEQPAFLN